MGSGSERMIELQQEKSDRGLAKKLGITYEELLQVGYEIDTEESNDGLIYNYIIIFKDDAPRKILNKIQGIDKNNSVWFSPSEFDN